MPWRSVITISFALQVGVGVPAQEQRTEGAPVKRRMAIEDMIMYLDTRVGGRSRGVTL